jgi:hypothetical protein
MLIARVHACHFTSMCQVRRGNLHKVDRRNGRDLYEFMLFTDQLLYSAATPLGLVLHRTIPMDASFGVASFLPLILLFFFSSFFV